MYVRRGVACTWGLTGGRSSAWTAGRGRDVPVYLHRYRAGGVSCLCFFFFQAEDGIRDLTVTGVQTCALPIFWSNCAAYYGLHTSSGDSPSSGRQAVVRGAVAPEDLAFAVVGDRQPEERLDGARELRVAVREVGGEDDPIVTDRVDDVLHRLFVAFDGHEALSLEVLARRHRQLRRVDVTLPLPVLVHPPEKERHPAAIPLEKRDTQTRVALQDAAHAETARRQHLLHRVAVDVLQHRVRAELLADLPQLRAGPLVEPQRNSEILERRPQRLVVGIVPVAPVHLVRPKEHAAEAELSRGAPDLAHGIVDVERGDHPGPEQPLGVLLAKLVEPVVVGPRHGGREPWLHVRDREREQSARGVDHRDIDAFGVHGFELDLRGPAALLERTPAFLVTGVVVPAPAPAPIRVGGDTAPRLAIEGEAYIAVVLGQPVRDAIPEGSIDVSVPQV